LLRSTILPDVDRAECFRIVDLDVNHLLFIVMDSREIHIGSFVESQNLVKFQFAFEPFTEGLPFELTEFLCRVPVGVRLEPAEESCATGNQLSREMNGTNNKSFGKPLPEVTHRIHILVNQAFFNG